jgi:hypothetical protein
MGSATQKQANQLNQHQHHAAKRPETPAPGDVATRGELMLIPWIVLNLVLIAFLHFGNHSIEGEKLILVPIVLLIVSASFLYDRNKRTNPSHDAEIVLGILCIVAILAATFVGIYANATSLAEYWRIYSGASYFNVYPAESAAGYQDATVMTYSLDAGVDSGRTYGFVDGRTKESTLYCVAPIASGATFSVSNSIQYWAAGVGCCFPRSEFTCGHAKNTSVRGAIVLPESKQKDELFKAAIQGAQYAYGIAPAEKYLLVDWKADPIEYHASLWRNAKKLFLIFSGVYLLISIMVGFIAWAEVKRKREAEARENR